MLSREGCLLACHDSFPEGRFSALEPGRPAMYSPGDGLAPRSGEAPREVSAGAMGLYRATDEGGGLQGLFRTTAMPVPWHRARERRWPQAGSSHSFAYLRRASGGDPRQHMDIFVLSDVHAGCEGRNYHRGSRGPAVNGRGGSQRSAGIGGGENRC